MAKKCLFIQNIRKTAILYASLLFIVLAFALMIGLSCLYVNSMLRNYNEYNRSPLKMTVILCALGMVLATALSTVLIRIDRAKKKADEENQQKSMALASIEKMREAIEQRDNLLKTVNHMAAILLATQDREDTMDSIRAGMELMGCAVDVDRVQIWQNEVIEGSLCFTLKHEWLSETGRQKEPVPIGLQIPYSEKPEWEIKFSHGEYINSPLCELSQSEQDLLAPYDIQSIVIVPLFLRDSFWGFFSLDDCHQKRTFSDDEINILRSGGLLIANAFLRNDMMQNIRKGSELLKSALNEAREANAAKSNFLATMSHEIRTPMNVILGVTESFLANENLLPDIREGYEKIYNAGDLLLHIINDILDLSKIEAGKFEIIPVKYETQSLINDAAYMNTVRYQFKPIKFKLQVDENIPLRLIGDELRIKQILNNLLSNAFKYTESGEIIMTCAIGNLTQPKSNMIDFVFCVNDTGQGMTPEEVGKIFDAYARFNTNGKNLIMGTGLGMTITDNLVKLMNGSMVVESIPGKGTSVTVHIPQGFVDADVLGAEAVKNFNNFIFKNMTQTKNQKIIREPMPYGKVLVVDDMKSNLDVAKLLLNPYQLQVDSAESGYDAINLIKTGNVYDIVFMDHMMPGINGIETTKTIRELGYKHPIIALTANAVTGQQEIFLANGFEGYISKPIDIRQLNDSLNKFIRDRHQ